MQKEYHKIDDVFLKKILQRTYTTKVKYCVGITVDVFGSLHGYISCALFRHLLIAWTSPHIKAISQDIVPHVLMHEWGIRFGRMLGTVQIKMHEQQ